MKRLLIAAALSAALSGSASAMTGTELYHKCKLNRTFGRVTATTVPWEIMNDMGQCDGYIDATRHAPR